MSILDDLLWARLLGRTFTKRVGIEALCHFNELTSQMKYGLLHLVRARLSECCASLDTRSATVLLSALFSIRAMNAQCYQFTGTNTSLTVNFQNLPSPDIIDLGSGVTEFFYVPEYSSTTATLSIGQKSITGNVTSSIQILSGSGGAELILGVQQYLPDSTLVASVKLDAASAPNMPVNLLPYGLPEVLPPVSAWNQSTALYGYLSTTDGTTSTPAELMVSSILPCSATPTTPPSALTLVDPVPDLLSGPQITTAITAANATIGQPFLADLSKGRPVFGIATDGVAQVVIRVPVSSLGQPITVGLTQDQCSNESSSQCIDEYGFLFDPANPPSSSSLYSNAASQNPIVLQGTSTASGPMAFVAYRAPSDFVRAGNMSDPASSQRSVSISITADGKTTTSSILLVRPPVMLIHGTFSDPSVFNNFLPITANSALFSSTLDYSADIDSQVTSTFPSYTATRHVSPIRQNVIGVEYNAPLLLDAMIQQIIDFKEDSPAPVNVPIASVQADVVAHSLGGLMARGMIRVGTNYAGTLFYGNNSFGRGYIHKLITLGTPHLGTNLALRTVNGDIAPLFSQVGGNDCTRNVAAFSGGYGLNSSTINGVVFPGAIFDQLGDPTQGIVSPTISLLNQPHPVMIPTAFLAAYFTSANNNAQIGINGAVAKVLCGSQTEYYPPGGDPFFVYGVQPCGDFPCTVIAGDFLADNYDFANWNNIFNTQSSDAIVPFASATFGQDLYWTASGVVHGPGTVGAGSVNDPHLGFAGPQLLDPASMAPARVLQLLNTSVTDTLSFVSVP